MISSGHAKSAPLQGASTPLGAAGLVATGEMADRVRTCNWSETPLGPISRWSSELITTVNLTLSSPAPARTLWGSDLILIYNDAYRYLPGQKHPDALGKPAREVYAASWNIVGPHLEQSFATGKPFSIEKLLIPIESGDGVKDFYLDYSCIPVFESGRVAGLFGILHDVTGTALAERNLRENEARAQRVLHSIGDAVIVTNAESRIAQMNPVAEHLTGWSAEEARNQPLDQVFRIIDEVSRQPVSSTAETAGLAKAAGRRGPKVLVRRDSSETVIDKSAAPVLDDQERFTGTVVVFRDIRERRAAERERAELSRQLALVMDATTDGVLSIDRNWKMIYRNRRAQEILQASGEVTGRGFWETFPDTRYEGSPYEMHYRRAMDEGVAGKFEAYYPQPLNKWFYVDAQPAKHGIVLFFRDITAQREESDRLRESAARLKAIYSSTLEYIGLTTPEGILLDTNSASLEFANSNRDDLIGKPFAECPWFTGTPGASEIVRKAIATAAAGEPVRQELALIRTDGATILFDFSLIPVRDESGKVILIVPEARDISEVKRAESALLKSEKLAAVGRLASSIAHEINNPLESVMNLIYLARHSELEAARGYLDLADQEIRRVSIIANQTLRFHKQASNPQAVSSADLFSTVMSIYEGRLRNARVSVEKKFRTDESVICFQGDVRQILNNLVSNALEAMPFGGRLLIRSRKGRNWKSGEAGMILTIADNGGGISPSVRKNIFDAFFTTKGTAGNGLGLWVCQEIVARHHGALRVRSTQRKGRSGTAFSLFLPFQQTIATAA